MQIAPNQTTVEAHVLSIEPDSGGWGATVKLHVVRNLSDQSRDFIKPHEGQELLLFSSSPRRPQVGDRIIAKATLLAGPKGERAVLQEISPVT
jgi:hypothetical protein